MRDEVGEIGVAVENANSPTGSGSMCVSTCNVEEGISIAIAIGPFSSSPPDSSTSSINASTILIHPLPPVTSTSSQRSFFAVSWKALLTRETARRCRRRRSKGDAFGEGSRKVVVCGSGSVRDSAGMAVSVGGFVGVDRDGMYAGRFADVDVGGMRCDSASCRISLGSEWIEALDGALS
jgi:hypothetical protein